MKKHLFIAALFLPVSILLMSWGYSGHSKINGNASLSFNQEMEGFHAWVAALITHASDADERKAWDPDEGPRHYIDIDKYDEFITYGTIPQNIDSAIALHSYGFVYDAGVLPWATLNAYDSLVSCLRSLNWDKAVTYAADLGHYVADGHMPLHITKNYNGQFTGNDDIHYRYESNMINNFGSQIIYTGDSISVVADVRQYIFDYLYINYTYVDSVLAADDYAQSVSPNVYSSAYKQALWDRTRVFTTMLFRNASHALAELIYSAWVEAGRPILFTGPFIFDPMLEVPGILAQNAPNPFSSSTQISFTLPEDALIDLSVKDACGRTMDVLVKGRLDRGSHSVEWSPGGLQQGIYFVVLRAGSVTEVRKMALMR